MTLGHMTHYPGKPSSTAKWTIMPNEPFMKPTPLKISPPVDFPSSQSVYSLERTNSPLTRASDYDFGHTDKWPSPTSMKRVSSSLNNSTWWIGTRFIRPFVVSPGCSKSGHANKSWISPRPMETDHGNGPCALSALAARKSERHVRTSFLAITKAGLMS